MKPIPSMRTGNRLFIVRTAAGVLVVFCAASKATTIMFPTIRITAPITNVIMAYKVFFTSLNFCCLKPLFFNTKLKYEDIFKHWF
jgi:hypothetical protein